MKKICFLLFIALSQVCLAQNYILQSLSGCTGVTGATCSAIYQDASYNIGIGNASPAASLDVTGPAGIASVIQADYSGMPPSCYYTASRNVSGTTYTDFTVNNVGQVSIGTGFNPGVDLIIQNHLWNPGGMGGPLGQISAGVMDDNGNPLLMVLNQGSSTASAGGLFVFTNSTDAISGQPNAALGIIDQSTNSTIMAVMGDGTMGIGVSTAAMAQLDVNAVAFPTWPLDYLFHVGNYNSYDLMGSELNLTEDYFAINDGGYVGIGQLNSGASLTEISDVNGIGASGTPLLTVDNGAITNPYLMVRGSSSGVNVGIGVDALSSNSTLAVQGQSGTILNILNGVGSGNGALVFGDESGAYKHEIINTSSSTLLVWPDISELTPTGTLEIYGNQLVDNSEHIDGNAQVDGNVNIGGNQQINGNDHIEGNEQLDGNAQVNGSVVIEQNELISGTVTIGANAAPGEPYANSAFTSYQLSVDGQIVAKEIIVNTTGWSDTVFSNTYELKPLTDIESFVQQNHHLPEIPTEQEVMKNGISLGEMNKLLLKKVEELTLYTINLEKRIKQLEVK